jgi:hypothetical protein
VEPAIPLADFNSIIQLPSPDPSALPMRAPCRILSWRRSRLTVLTDRPIPASTPVSVEYDDALYLGEVAGEICLNPSEDRYEVRILIEQVLSGLDSLVKLRARLLDESSSRDESGERIGVKVRKTQPTIPIDGRVR